jgi:hypothetical protein
MNLPIEPESPEAFPIIEGADVAIESAGLASDDVVDDSEIEPHTRTRFQITSYGADMTVFELTHRLGKELIVPPAF